MSKEAQIAVVKSLLDTADKILADNIVRVRANDPAFRAALDLSLRYEERLQQLIKGDGDGSA